MKYTEPKFMVPVGSPKLSQKEWDRAFLSPDEFEAKYPEEADASQNCRS